MNMIQINPFREIEDILKRYNDRGYSSLFGREPEGVLAGSWAPSVDIKETKDAYVVRGELPGVKKDDVDISIDDNLLTIRGEKKMEEEVNEHQTHRTECYYGSFERSFTLPKQVDINKVSAAFESGILELQIPKAEEAKPKQIQVKIK